MYCTNMKIRSLNSCLVGNFFILKYVTVIWDKTAQPVRKMACISARCWVRRDLSFDRSILHKRSSSTFLSHRQVGVYVIRLMSLFLTLDRLLYISVVSCIEVLIQRIIDEGLEADQQSIMLTEPRLMFIYLSRNSKAASSLAL